MRATPGEPSHWHWHDDDHRGLPRHERCRQCRSRCSCEVGAGWRRSARSPYCTCTLRQRCARLFPSRANALRRCKRRLPRQAPGGSSLWTSLSTRAAHGAAASLLADTHLLVRRHRVLFRLVAGVVCVSHARRSRIATSSGGAHILCRSARRRRLLRAMWGQRPLPVHSDPDDVCGDSRVRHRPLRSHRAARSRPLGVARCSAPAGT